MDLYILVLGGAVGGYLWAQRRLPFDWRALLGGAVLGAIAGGSVAAVLLAFIAPLQSILILIYALPWLVVAGLTVGAAGLAARAFGGWWARRR